MDFEIYENTQEDIKEVQEFENLNEANDFPPKFSGEGEGNTDFPPSFGKLGESFDHRIKRHELESDIEGGFEIAAKNSLKELEELEKKEAEKK